MSDTLIKVENVSKKFCRSLKRSLWYGLNDLKDEFRGHRVQAEKELRPDEFWAVKDVSFEVKRGECLGLIGHNGAGKTTLLRILNGLIKLDQGRIEMRGRVGALIALGAGFNPVLTGRENIYTNAAVLGMTKKEVNSKLEEVVEFAEIGEFIDTPVQNYSSGMSVRLGFSVAAVMIKPDILFLDEVLAVGDIGFVVKCMNRVRKITETSAVIFVTHNMQHISSFCTRAAIMDHGELALVSCNTADVIDKYYSLINYASEIKTSEEVRLVSMKCSINGIEISEAACITDSSVFKCDFDIEVSSENKSYYSILYINDESQAAIICIPILQENDYFKFSKGRIRYNIKLNDLNLNTGKYSFVFSIYDKNTRSVAYRAQGLNPFRVKSSDVYWGKIIKKTIATVV